MWPDFRRQHLRPNVPILKFVITRTVGSRDTSLVFSVARCSPAFAVRGSELRGRTLADRHVVDTPTPCIMQEPARPTVHPVHRVRGSSAPLRSAARASGRCTARGARVSTSIGPLQANEAVGDRGAGGVPGHAFARREREHRGTHVRPLHHPLVVWRSRALRPVCLPASHPPFAAGPRLPAPDPHHNPSGVRRRTCRAPRRGIAGPPGRRCVLLVRRPLSATGRAASATAEARLEANAGRPHYRPCHANPIRSRHHSATNRPGANRPWTAFAA